MLMKFMSAYIYDGITVDELTDINRITGLPEMHRKGIGHNLNTRPDVYQGGVKAIFPNELYRDLWSKREGLPIGSPSLTVQIYRSLT